jgi:hypothetical protein
MKVANTSSGSPKRRLRAVRTLWGFSLTLALIVAFPATALAGKPEWLPPMNGGDVEGHVETPTAEEQQLIDWKDSMATAVAESPYSLVTVDGTVLLATADEGFPSSYGTAIMPRQQKKWWWCGPASAQVIINRTRGYLVSGADGDNTTANYKTQTTIARWLGIEFSGSTDAYGLRNVLNAYANLSATGTYLPFSVVSTDNGALFHSRVKISSYSWNRGMGVPVKMTYSSHHLPSWSDESWWTKYKNQYGASHPVLHWVVTRGYSGVTYDGTDNPKAYYVDSAGGYGGGTGWWTESSRIMFELNYWHTNRTVY